MKVLLSIKPEYAESILNGVKVFEFRKAVFQRPGVKIAVIYATLPVGKVIGQFEVEEILCDTPSRLWTSTQYGAGISHKLFKDYFSGKKQAYALKIKRPQRYKKPLAIKDVLPSGIAPQSFCYLP